MDQTAMNYRPIEEYTQTIEAMYDFTTLLLSSFNKASNQTREVIIRNFIARGMTGLQSILRLWSLGHYQDCWILHRALVDRLFHLRALAEKDEFEIFEKWSFVQQFEAINQVRSDVFFASKTGKKYMNMFMTKENKRRYAEIKKENIKWSRPKAEQVADKSFGMPFLYSYAYDYGSTLVHPLANDGEDDYQRMMQGALDKSFDQRVVVHNSILIQTMLIQEGLNASKFLWRAIVYKFVEQCRYSLEGSKSHFETLITLVSQGPEFKWCQEKDKQC